MRAHCTSPCVSSRQGQQATEVKVMVTPEEATYHGRGPFDQRSSAVKTAGFFSAQSCGLADRWDFACKKWMMSFEELGRTWCSLAMNGVFLETGSMATGQVSWSIPWAQIQLNIGKHNRSTSRWLEIWWINPLKEMGIISSKFMKFFQVLDCLDCNMPLGGFAEILGLRAPCVNTADTSGSV